MRSGRARPAQWTWWAIAAGVSLLATSQWLHAPSVEYLIGTLVATAAALATVPLVPRGQRRWAAAATLAMGVAAGLAIPAQTDLWRVDHQWDEWRSAATARGLAQLRRALDESAARATSAADHALEAPGDRAAAFGALAAEPLGRPELGVLLSRADEPVAWAGTLTVPLGGVRDGAGVVVTQFYLALTSTQRRGDARATGVVLVDAAPPADRLSEPVATRVARQAGLTGFLFQSPSDSSASPDLLQYSFGGVRLFDVRSGPLPQSTVEYRIVEAVRMRAGLAFLLALACFIVGVWRGTYSLATRFAALTVGLACTALIPLSQYSNISRLFDPSVYFTARGGPLTGNAGALATTSALVLLGVLAVIRRRGRPVSRSAAGLLVVLVAGLGPFLLRELARGVVTPGRAIDGPLWLMWEVPLFLAAVSVLLAGAAAGSVVLGRMRGLPLAVAPVAATVCAWLAPVVWEAPGQWPWWYTILWIAAIVALALSRQSRYIVLSAATVAALGATTLVWGRTARGRVVLAENDLAGLSQVDSIAPALLERFGATLSADAAATTRRDLLQQYVVSDIAPAGYPAALSAWPSDSGPSAVFQTATIPIPARALATVVAAARRTHQTHITAVATDTAVVLVMAARANNGGVTAVVLAPRSRLFESDPFAQLLGLDVDAAGEPPYTVRLREPLPLAAANVAGGSSWRRAGSTLHGDWIVRTGTGAAVAHVEIELRPPGALVQRGALLVVLDLLIVAVLWLVSVTADGGAGRWLRARRRTWGRSYRARLTLALFAFFVFPAAAFAVWWNQQLAADASASRALLVRETLRSLAPPDTAAWLASESDRLDAPLLLYARGELRAASDELYEAIAPVGRFLDPRVEEALVLRGEDVASRVENVGGSTTLFGYRLFDASGTSIVVAAPARADELALGRRRRDLGVLVLFATVVGALAALWLSGIAARQLALPIRALREAALSIAGGNPLPPLEPEPTAEFRDVFAAFRRMATDLNATQGALQEAQRRTAAVLRNVASGVVAVDTDGRVALANPRAEALLTRPLAAGASFTATAPEPLGALVAQFLRGAADDEEFELEIDQQQLRGRLTRLVRSGGAVVTLDDVTAVARAQRVLAWGEMARQIAHEIKNPLTPIRLGVQHLRRARADARVDFDRVLEHNVNRILTEIDRLDEIARAFSRYGSAPDERQPPVPTDVATVVREVVALERMGEDTQVEWRVEGVDDPMPAMARRDELKEVMLNVLENARLAHARHVVVDVTPGGADGRGGATITVRDDGHGIAASVLPRIFEPHFSTRTSGSGLGLAISRQILDGWGGSIGVASAPGEGTVVTITLRAADAEKVDLRFVQDANDSGG